jgi:hypothetical protein
MLNHQLPVLAQGHAGHAFQLYNQVIAQVFLEVFSEPANETSSYHLIVDQDA